MCVRVREDAKTVNSSRLRIFSTCLLISQSITIFTTLPHSSPFSHRSECSTRFPLNLCRFTKELIREEVKVVLWKATCRSYHTCDGLQTVLFIYTSEYICIHMHVNEMEPCASVCIALGYLLVSRKAELTVTCTAINTLLTYMQCLCSVHLCMCVCVFQVDVIKAFLECRKKWAVQQKKSLPLTFTPLQSSLSLYAFPSLSPSRSLSLSPFLYVSHSFSRSDFLFKTHMTLCQIMLLDLAGSCVFLLTLSPLFLIPALESHLINRSTLPHTYHCINT